MPPRSVARKCSDAKRGVVAGAAKNFGKASSQPVDSCIGTLGVDAASVSVALDSHMAEVACRVQEMIGAGYSSALEDLAHVLFAEDEEAAEEAFPCIRESQGSTIPEDDDGGSVAGAFVDGALLY